MKLLNVMDLAFDYKAGIGGYESVMLERSWNGSAYLVLKINKAMPNTDVLVQDNIIWFDKEYHKGYIIERVQETLENDTRMLEITASSLQALLRDYVTIPAAGSDEQVVTDNREGIVRSYVTLNCISPADTSRIQYPIILGTDTNLGTATTARTRYKNLADEVVSILSPEFLGWRLDIDLAAEKLVFKVLQGVNRTAGQAVNSRVLFGTEYGNVAKFEKIQDRLNARSVAYVGGTGEGASRVVQKVTASGVTRKKEIFIDARNITATAELTEKGQQSLVQYGEVKSFNFEALNRQFDYETDWNLGDFVTIVQEDGTSDDRQVIKLTEYIERNNMRVVPEFGKPELTVNQVFSSISQRIGLLEGEEVNLAGVDADKLDGKHASEFMARGTVGATDLNTVKISGVYRIDMPANVPTECYYGQLLVLNGWADTIVQIAFSYSGNGVWIRSGNPPLVGGGGVWTAWRRIANATQYAAIAAPAASYASLQACCNSIRAALTAAGITL